MLNGVRSLKYLSLKIAEQIIYARSNSIYQKALKIEHIRQRNIHKNQPLFVKDGLKEVVIYSKL